MADTTVVSLTSTAYTDLGAMPLHIQAAAAPLYLIIAAGEPAPAASAVGIRLVGNGSGEASGLFTPYTVADTRHVWARAVRTGGAAAIVTGAPV